MKIVKVDEVLKRGKISQLSPLLLIAKELGLNYLIEEGGQLTGPAVGLSVVIDKLTKVIPISSMADLCCGTGALAKIALKNGVKKILCVDKNVSAAEDNIGKVKNVIIVKADILKFRVEDFFDLIVLDAPRHLLSRLYRRFKEFSLKSNIFVLWHGSCEEKEWNEEIRGKLREVFKVVYSFSAYGEEISACSLNQKGIKWLDKFYRKW